MTQKLVFSAAFLLFFTLFSLNLSAQKKAAQKVVSGTVLLQNRKPLDQKSLLNALRSTWKVRADSLNAGDKTLIFNTQGGATVMIAYLDYPAATDLVGVAARFSWIWSTAQQETASHQAQLVISVIGDNRKSLDLYKIFTQTTAAVLETTSAAGVLIEAQYLLLSPGYFSASASNMLKNQIIPLYCWVYFGRPGEGGGFTLGLAEFGLPEMEISASEQAEPEVHALLYDAALTVLKYGTQVKDGETITTEEGNKVMVKLVPSAFVDNPAVLRLEY